MTRHRFAVRAAVVCVLLTYACASPAAVQPQTPIERLLQFENGGVRLTGTLTIPVADEPVAAVVLMGGNGPWRGAYDALFGVHTDALLAAGYAVFRYDRRGEGGSGGDFDRASFEELARDAIAAVEVVAAQREVADERVGLLGHSMGGWIAPLAASLSDRVAFVVTLAGAGVGPLEQTLYARMVADRRAGLDDATVQSLATLRRAIVVYYTDRTRTSYERAQSLYGVARSEPWFQHTSEWRELNGVGESLPTPEILASLDRSHPDLLLWFRRDGAYDAAAPLRSVDVPMLAVFGDRDGVVPLEMSVDSMTRAFAERDDQSLLTLRVLPEADHSLRLSDGTLSPRHLPGLIEWLDELPAP